MSTRGGRDQRPLPRSNRLDQDDIGYYEELFDPVYTDLRGPRGRPRLANYTPKISYVEQMQEIAEAMPEGGDTPMSYVPAKFEEGWLQAAVRDFYLQGLIDDIEAQIKGGKEASVYRCRATQTTGERWLAAKVYRPRRFRNLRNDKRYREGRILLDGDGKGLKMRDHRLGRALRKGSDFGAQVRHTSWLMHEFGVLRMLHAAGADVPYPFAASENAILMSYIGDGRRAAPTLHETIVAPDEAGPLYRRLMANVERMIEMGHIHGDLSAFNVLYWEGAVTLIDFPQVVDSVNNPHAYEILARDVRRLQEYFAPYGVIDESADALTARLWARAPHIPEISRQADASRYLIEEDDE